MTAASINPGAINLLETCAGVRAGERVLLAIEDPGHGFYSADLAPCVAAAAHSLGCDVRQVDTGFHPEARSIPAELLPQFADADVVVSLSRLGDQLRFETPSTATRTVQCYALDARTLASTFGTIPYPALVALRDLTDRALAAATEIRITCGRGTDVRGRAPRGHAPSDTHCLRFPLSVFSPISAEGFSGRVAMPGFLTGTGARYYDPFTITLPPEVFANFEQGRFTEFTGDDAGARRATKHLMSVAERYGLDHRAVHSWHAGIHPGCRFEGPIERSYEVWSGSAFGNPRILHFHTCGAEPPGEISWNVIDPTVEADGIALWKDGVFRPHLLPGGGAILDGCQELRQAFEAPQREIGL